MADSEELDFSNMDEGMDDIDWSDVKSELQQNREMIVQEGAPSGGLDDIAGGDEGLGESTGGGELDISFLLEIPLVVTIEVGRSSYYIKDLMKLNLDSIIELKKKVGEPLNVLVNDKLVAKGEAVIQNEKFALKITEIVNEKERLERLKS